MLTVYKCFIRPHLDYGDVIYDQPNLPTFTNKIESVITFSTVKPPNSGHLRVCAKLPAIPRCPLLGGFVEIFKF